jgi:lipopolysaccharide export system protein LptA
MRTIKWIILAFTVGSVISLLFGQEKTEGLRLIHADILKRENIGKRILQKLEGNVRFQQGKTTMDCDMAIQFLDDDKAALIGHVQIFDETKSLFADTVYFFQKERKQVAVGHVRSITDSDTTTADRMTYYEVSDKMVSEGSVRITNPKERKIVTGGYAEYLRTEEYGKIIRSPILIQYDSLGAEVMKIVGDTVETYDRGQRTIVTGGVEITKPGIKAQCGRAEHIVSEEKIILSEKPIVWQTNQQISGDTLLLFMKDSQLVRAEVVGNALATSDADTLNKGRWVNKLTGQNMNFYFADEKVEKVVVENQATSIYHVIEDNQYKGFNEVSGERIELFLSDGEVNRVLVDGNPEVSRGKYSPPQL